MFHILGDQCPSYEMVKNWEVSFKRDKILRWKSEKTCEIEPVCQRPKLSEQVDGTILSDRRIGLKRILEILMILYERVHHIVHIDFNIKKTKQIYS